MKFQGEEIPPLSPPYEHVWGHYLKPFKCVDRCPRLLSQGGLGGAAAALQEQQPARQNHHSAPRLKSLEIQHYDDISNLLDIKLKQLFSSFSQNPCLGWSFLRSPHSAVFTSALHQARGCCRKLKNGDRHAGTH